MTSSFKAAFQNVPQQNPLNVHYQAQKQTKPIHKPNFLIFLPNPFVLNYDLSNRAGDLLTTHRFHLAWFMECVVDNLALEFFSGGIVQQNEMARTLSEIITSYSGKDGVELSTIMAKALEASFICRNIMRNSVYLSLRQLAGNNAIKEYLCCNLSTVDDLGSALLQREDVMLDLFFDLKE